MNKKAVETKKKQKKVVPTGIGFINATFNNTMVTITDPSGNAVAWSSAGKMGFKGSKKSTPYAAQITADEVAKHVVSECHMTRLTQVFVTGPGQGRESAIRALQAAGLLVVSIIDTTPVPHNGCRPPKKRRV